MNDLLLWSVLLIFVQMDAMVLLALDSRQTVGRSEWGGENPLKRYLFSNHRWDQTSKLTHPFIFIPVCPCTHNRVKYCTNCEDPADALPYLVALAPRHYSAPYEVTAELVYGVPNYGEGKKLLNKVEVEDRIAFLDRGGKVSIVEKALKAQAQGAVGVIVADNGQCDADFNYCGRQAGGKREGGFGAYDELTEWRAIRIPVLMVNVEVAERLRTRMPMERKNLGHLGMQNVTVIPQPPKRTHFDEF